MLDCGFRVLDASPGVDVLLGLEQLPRAGTPLNDICHDTGLLATVADGCSAAYPSRTMLVRRGLDLIERHLLVQVVRTPTRPVSILVMISDATRQVQLEDELMAARAALDVTTDAIFLVDTLTWRVRHANAPALARLGLDYSELPDLCFQRFCRRMRTDDGSVPTPDSLSLPDFHSGEYTYVRHDGDTLPVEVHISSLRLVRHELLVVVLRDISERVNAASELRAASSRCGITFNQAATGLAHVTLDGRWSKVNPRLVAITGYPEAEMLAMTVSQLTHPADLESDALAHPRLLSGELPYCTREKRYIRKNGTQVWVSVTSSLARDAEGAPLHFIGMVEDISERKRAEERIRHLASHDVMTGLPNRLGLQDHLERTLEAARLGRRQVGVVFVDMDKLKEINDTHGHEEGDLALIGLARQLQQQVRSGDIVSRIGGDEFVIVLADVGSRADINAILDRTLSALAGPPGTTALAAATSCSIGISVFPEDGADGRTLIRNADLAMYRAKQRGGARYEYYSGGGTTETRAAPNLQSPAGKT